MPKISGIIIIELKELPLKLPFNILLNIIEVTIVAEVDFLFIPTYMGIRLKKLYPIEYTKILIIFCTTISTVNVSVNNLANALKKYIQKFEKIFDMTMDIKVNMITIVNFASIIFFLFIGYINMRVIVLFVYSPIINLEISTAAKIEKVALTKVPVTKNISL